MEVTIPCPCPDKPHESDTVTFRDRLPFTAAIAIRNEVRMLYMDIRTDVGEADVSFEVASKSVPVSLLLATLSRGYLVYGIASWSLVDASGTPMPVSDHAIEERILDNIAVASAVADEADTLYSEQVMLPLATRGLGSLLPSQTAGSTSPTTDSSTPSETSRKRSKRSSTSTTPTDDTAMTSSSLDGDSSYSRSSA